MVIFRSAPFYSYIKNKWIIFNRYGVIGELGVALTPESYEGSIQVYTVKYSGWNPDHIDYTLFSFTYLNSWSPDWISDNNANI